MTSPLTPEEIARNIYHGGPSIEKIAAAIALARAEAFKRAAEIAREPITNPRIDLGSGYISCCNQIARAIEQEAARDL